MKKGLQRLLSYARRAVEDYDMIEEGETIAVGVSGGKDSLSLLLTMAALSEFYPKRFHVAAISIDLGLEGSDYSKISELCEEIGVPFYLEPSDISHIIFDLRKESNPCSLCAKLRRGMLNSAALKHGIHKVALGHHFDDVVETFMLNLFYEGRIGAFQPVTYLDRTGITVIRPFLYAPEKDIRYFARHADLPILEVRCPADGNTERSRMKQFLADLEKDNKGLRHRIFGAIQKAGLDGFHAARVRRYKDEEPEDGTEER
ncbi:MAG: tRNA 2-thiocytidine(32) synthetase TtcA [Clostridia bacterium]|nr:tRNA 2-thiocytidine(32) synthetase TtcA [Clostridia bacterium]